MSAVSLYLFLKSFPWWSTDSAGFTQKHQPFKHACFFFKCSATVAVVVGQPYVPSYIVPNPLHITEGLSILTFSSRKLSRTVSACQWGAACWAWRLFDSKSVSPANPPAKPARSSQCLFTVCMYVWMKDGTQTSGLQSQNVMLSRRFVDIQAASDASSYSKSTNPKTPRSLRWGFRVHWSPNVQFLDHAGEK